MQHEDGARAVRQTLDLMVQRTYATMTNDSLISVPLFVFMGYLVERANLIERLFRSMHLALARLPGALGVATLITCAIFATATGIVGAVVTLMGLLAMPAMLKAGYSVRLTAGSITAGGCLGILIPPSVMLIVYGATTGVSVVQLYAGAFFPGIMLAGLYVLYVMIVAKLRPDMAPPLSKEERHIPLQPGAEALRRQGYRHAVPGLLAGLFKRRDPQITGSFLARNLMLVAAPLAAFVLITGATYSTVTEPPVVYEIPDELRLGSGDSFDSGLAEPPSEDGGLAEPPGAAAAPEAAAAQAEAAEAAEDAAAERLPAPYGFWVFFAVCVALLAVFYALLNWTRLEVVRLLMSSFFPLALMIVAVLGSIVFGLATPSEAAAMGALGGALLALAYRRLTMPVLRESVYLTAKTSAMVCWLFVGSSIFSAAFALLGGQGLVEQWVLSLGLTPIQFMLLAQIIIFLLGWPLEWTEIIVIFMPIFVPLLKAFGIDPLFFGLLVALNLQTAFLSPPVAMSAFYLKGVAPPHVTLNQIFLGMMPFMGIQLLAIFLLYMFPGIGLWLPTVLYR
ncbi:TRAP transporter, DctM-like membrane protein [Bordetella bronchiseptica 980-2]|nr:TRAP transporter, DctM-like membrane protein [Bordetella bronchiseptica 980-2]KCV63782.1 TRAP transporter, DctM-like membrane protein [Bordetella bronchiseptica 980]KDB62502.1 TRAP transporter, DctM-like membrane protein [Bordetella bronchiseptica B18-5 (C3)]KDB68580.1 TRAP transporter, DctM-like membrane protein [Bordetella bronchiseptica A1-7]KDB69024.1 TRAP transporter, DctM-like membrane protein [Bordetella bronchiseptica B20-10725633]KDB89612.1 TRAP transporter, DctM-like membrane prot